MTRESGMTAQLIPRVPKHKKQPTAEQLRQQLALAADEIIRLREVETRLFVSLAAREIMEKTIPSGRGENGREGMYPLPPKPPSCRVEYHGLFGPLMFDSAEECDKYLQMPWWRRLFWRTL